MTHSSSGETRESYGTSCAKPSMTPEREIRKRQIIHRLRVLRSSMAALERELSRVELGLAEPFAFPDDPPAWLLKSNPKTVESALGANPCR
jgi:hypothetical protein